MPGSEQFAASRRFDASAARMKPKWVGAVAYGSMALLLIFGGVAAAVRFKPVAAHAFIWLFIVPYLGFVFWVMRPKKLHIDVTSEALSVNEGSGGVFPVAGATLGEWYAQGFGTTGGLALHVGDGRRGFVLAGRDHRVDPGMQLDAPPTSSADAWMSASDFDQLLGMLGRRTGLRSDAAAPHGPMRCLLFENSTFSRTLNAMRGRRPSPKAVIEVDGDIIRLIDAKTNALIVWAAASQVTASRGRHQYSSRASRIIWPSLDVCFPGLRPILIATAEGRRFSWRDKVPNEPSADFLVSAGDWLALVKGFGFEQFLDVSSKY